MSARQRLKEKRAAAAAKGRAERERRIKADRVNSQRANAAFIEWLKAPAKASQ